MCIKSELEKQRSHKVVTVMSIEFYLLLLVSLQCIEYLKFCFHQCFTFKSTDSPSPHYSDVGLNVIFSNLQNPPSPHCSDVGRKMISSYQNMNELRTQRFSCLYIIHFYSLSFIKGIVSTIMHDSQIGTLKTFIHR